MTDTDDTFSSDTDYDNSEGSLSYFSDPKGKIISFPANYDPKTGEDLNITQIKNEKLPLTPIKIFNSPDGHEVPVKFNEIDEALKLGLKPKEQVESEQAAQKSKTNLQQGNIEGYNPSKLESFTGSLGSGLNANITPQLEGLGEGLNNLVYNKGSFGTGYEQGRDVAQALETSRQKTNPNSSLAGDIIGSGTTAALTGGVSSIPKMAVTGATLGGLSSGFEAANKGQNAYDIQNAAQEGALTGGAEGTIGGYVGKGVQGATNIAKNAGYGFIPDSVRSDFLRGWSGENLADPELNKEAYRTGATYAKNINDVIFGKDGIKSEIGQGKSDLLHQIGENTVNKPSDILSSTGENLGSSDVNINTSTPPSHTPIIDLINQQQNKLYNAYDKTGFSHEKESIQNAYNLLDETKDTLNLNPNDPVAMDLIKQKLQDVQYDTVKPIKKSRSALQAINNTRSGIMNYLQDQSDKLGGTNAGYKSLIDAEDADKLHSVKFTPNDIISLGSDNPSAEVVNKVDNLNQLNSKIQNNPAISDSTKIRLSTLVNDMSTVSERAAAAKRIGAGGKNNVANQAGYVLSRTPEPVQAIGKTIYGIPQAVYAGLPLEIQKLISIYPEYRQRFQQEAAQ